MRQICNLLFWAIQNKIIWIQLHSVCVCVCVHLCWKGGRCDLWQMSSLGWVSGFIKISWEGSDCLRTSARVTHQCCKHSSGCWAKSRPHAGDTEEPALLWKHWPASHRWSYKSKLGSFRISEMSQQFKHGKLKVWRMFTHLHLLKASMASFHSCSSNSTIPVRYEV